MQRVQVRDQRQLPAPLARPQAALQGRGWAVCRAAPRAGIPPRRPSLQQAANSTSYYSCAVDDSTLRSLSASFDVPVTVVPDLLLDVDSLAAGGEVLLGKPMGADPALDQRRLIPAPQGESSSAVFFFKVVHARPDRAKRPTSGIWRDVRPVDLSITVHKLVHLDRVAQQTVVALDATYEVDEHGRRHAVCLWQPPRHLAWGALRRSLVE